MKSTKELARQLGLLRRRSTTSNQQSRDVRRVMKTNQMFSYLIVIDFESTCWKDKKSVSQEVIEFPAVLLNTSNGSIESEFHTYVLPEENPQLSAFCTELTGITQDQVESGVPLRFCLSKFSRWLTQQENEKNIAYNTRDKGKNLCTFVTWSDWDLSVCLHYECRRKQLLKPPVLNSWIDLRATYKNFYERKPNGLHGALQDVGMEFHGRQHSGLDDARNTAYLAWRMMCDGCLMEITRTMPGTQWLKRKQTATQQVQPTKVHVKPNTGKERQEPDGVNTHRCTDSEDRLISYTQGICDALVPGDKILNASLSSSTRFKIWDDDAHPATVRSVVRPETSLPSCTDTQIGFKPRTNDVLLVKTSLGAQTQNENGGVGTRNPRDTMLESLDVGKWARCVGNSFTHKRNSSLNGYGNICGNKQVWDGGDGGSPNTPVVFKTPQSAAVHKRSVKPSPSNGFKTPRVPRPCATPGSHSFKRPTQPSNARATPSLVGGKITPPMCQCGRRAKRRTAQSPGPNANRVFYSCTTGRRSGEAGLRDATNAKRGCGYFKWESAVLVEKQRFVATSPVDRVSPWSVQRRSAVTSALEIKKSASALSTPVGFTAKRLGVAMRSVPRQQNQLKL